MLRQGEPGEPGDGGQGSGKIGDVRLSGPWHNYPTPNFEEMLNSQSGHGNPRTYLMAYEYEYEYGLEKQVLCSVRPQERGHKDERNTRMCTALQPSPSRWTIRKPTPFANHRVSSGSTNSGKIGETVSNLKSVPGNMVILARTMYSVLVLYLHSRNSVLFPEHTLPRRRCTMMYGVLVTRTLP